MICFNVKNKAENDPENNTENDIKNNDIFLSDRDLAVTSGVDALAIIARQHIQTLYNEMIYNYDGGINYFRDVFSGTPNFISFETDLRRSLSTLTEIQSIEDMKFTYDEMLKYTVTFRTIYGIRRIEGTLNGPV